MRRSKVARKSSKPRQPSRHMGYSSMRKRSHNSRNSRKYRATSASPIQKKPRAEMTRPPNVHMWSRREGGGFGDVRLRTEMVEPAVAQTMDNLTSRDNVLSGGSDEAKEMYGKLHWDGNTSTEPAVNTKDFPLDVLVVKRVKRAESFFVNDPQYESVTRSYRLLDQSCIVCDENGSILCVFVTKQALPSLGLLYVQAKKAQEEAEANLVARHSFAVGGDYTRDASYRDKMQNMHVRMKGTIWNDGLQTYTSATPGWQGKYFTQYFKRRPGSDVIPFALPYVGMYLTETAVVPAIAEERMRLHNNKRLPSALPGVHASLMPATQVGMSRDFSVRTHADSCVSGVTETIFWANRDLPNLRFAVTSAEIQFDIGRQECILFQKGNEMHGTVPGGPGSCGLVLISKRNTLYHFKESDSFTNRTRNYA